ncbi:hypothetical protein PR048_012223 [Dryococelus australis]|uniref:EGF-like domain-containing protein n=1 Tax=Dryococelus australis TaxID=614101 RepID=A0ABQ9HNW2_9NEOP|nr:hypothetical protein PR048_012223 [Dryococelus australis]
MGGGKRDIPEKTPTNHIVRRSQSCLSHHTVTVALCSSEFTTDNNLTALNLEIWVDTLHFIVGLASAQQMFHPGETIRLDDNVAVHRPAGKSSSHLGRFRKGSLYREQPLELMNCWCNVFLQPGMVTFTCHHSVNEQRLHKSSDRQTIDVSEIQNRAVSLVQQFYIGIKIKLDPGSELGSRMMLVQPGLTKLEHTSSSLAAQGKKKTSQPAHLPPNVTSRSSESVHSSRPTPYRVYCERKSDDCSSQPCFNSGTCIDASNSYVCNCAEGYSGKRCEEFVDESSSQLSLLFSRCGGLVIMKQRKTGRAAETGYHRENPSISGIVGGEYSNHYTTAAPRWSTCGEHDINSRMLQPRVRRWAQKNVRVEVDQTSARLMSKTKHFRNARNDVTMLKLVSFHSKAPDSVVMQAKGIICYQRRLCTHPHIAKYLHIAVPLGQQKNVPEFKTRATLWGLRTLFSSLSDALSCACTVSSLLSGLYTMKMAKLEVPSEKTVVPVFKKMNTNGDVKSFMKVQYLDLHKTPVDVDILRIFLQEVPTTDLDGGITNLLQNLVRSFPTSLVPRCVNPKAFPFLQPTQPTFPECITCNSGVMINVPLDASRHLNFFILQFTAMPQSVTKVHSIAAGPSDHSPVLGLIHYRPHSLPIFPRFNFRSANWCAYQTSLHESLDLTAPFSTPKTSTATPPSFPTPSPPPPTPTFLSAALPPAPLPSRDCLAPSKSILGLPSTL